jgi:hypothetical protein
MRFKHLNRLETSWVVDAVCSGRSWHASLAARGYWAFTASSGAMRVAVQMSCYRKDSYPPESARGNLSLASRAVRHADKQSKEDAARTMSHAKCA